MKESASYKPEDTIALLLVGPPKTGKTRLLAAFPDPYFLDVDGNLASAVRVLGDKKFFYDSPLKDAKTKSDVYKTALASLQLATKDPRVKTVGVDSLSLLCEYICEWIVSEHIRMGDRDKNGKPIEAMTLPDYGKLLNILRSIIFDLRNSGKYVVVTSHQQVSVDELTGAKHYALAIPGQGKDTLGGAFTDVWGTSATAVAGGKTEYAVFTRPSGFHPALGTSIPTLAAKYVVTDKTPAQIWTELSPQLSIKAAAK